MHLFTNDWKQIPIPHPDITAVEISGPFGTLRILNIYNNCNNNDSLNHISNYMKVNPLLHSIIAPIHYIRLSDFNRHHPLWDEACNNHLFTKHNLDLAQLLINMLT